MFSFINFFKDKSKEKASIDRESYTSFVSADRELDELLKYYMSSDKSEQEMVEWALLNTFGSLKQKLEEDDRDWVTPSFHKSLIRARKIIPPDKIKIINLLDEIINSLSDESKPGETPCPDIENTIVINEDDESYTSFVSKERELDELLKYYMSSNKSEEDMVEWALLNTFGSLKQKLEDGDTEWVTSSFLQSLKRARKMMPLDKVKMINLLDEIITALPDTIN